MHVAWSARRGATPPSLGALGDLCARNKNPDASRQGRQVHKEAGGPPGPGAVASPGVLCDLCARLMLLKVTLAHALRLVWPPSDAHARSAVVPARASVASTPDDDHPRREVHGIWCPGPSPKGAIKPFCGTPCAGALPAAAEAWQQHSGAGMVVRPFRVTLHGGFLHFHVGGKHHKPDRCEDCPG